LENDYPLIFKTISNRIRQLITNSNNKTQNDQKISHLDDKIINSWFVIPYFSSYSEKFREVVGVSDMRVAYYGVNKLRNIIKAHKDTTSKFLQKNVVYKLNCNNCEATYVGQMKRQLKTRIEHRNHIKRNTSTHSVIADHRISDHEFDWNNVEILDVKRNLNKRLISEMINIKSQSKGLNCKRTRIPLTGLTFHASRIFRIFIIY